MRYIIHPALEINIYTNNKGYINYFENEYRRVSSYKAQNNHTVIDVQILKRLPIPQKNDRLRKSSFMKLFVNEYLIRDLDTDHVSIYFKDKVRGKFYAKLVTLFLQSQILEPIIYYKLLERNILFMHAAGVSDGKNGYLFPAYGGTGKTTLTLGLMCEGMLVLGDDLLVVEPDTKVVYPYLRPLHIFTYNMNTLRGAAIPLNIKAKLIIKDILRAILERFTGQKFLISTRVRADVLYKTFKAGESVQYRKIIFLTNIGQHEIIKMTPENIRGLAKKIMESEDLNDSLYSNVLKPSEKDEVVEREIGVITNVLKQVPYIEFVNVRQLDYKDLSSFKQMLLTS